MKLSHIITGIAAAVLIGMVGGCSVEDEVKKAVEDELKPNVIYAVNGTGGAITLSVTGSSDRTIYAQSLTPVTYTLTDNSSYKVSYPGAQEASFAYGSVYLYAATNCDANGYVSDKVDGNRVHVVNLTAQTFSGSVQVRDAQGTLHVISDSAAACGVTSTNQLDAIVVGNGMQIKVGSGSWQNVPDIPAELISKANSVKLDVVVYSTSSGTVVPMAGYEDLL